MTTKELRARLHNTQGPDHQFTAKCPTHDDQQNSLSVGVGRDGRILLHCFAGCDARDIVEELGLSMKDLRPEREQSRRRPSILSRGW